MSDIARRPAGRRILEPDRQERRQPGEALRAAARVIFGDPGELPRIRDLSAFGKFLLAAAAVTALASTGAAGLCFRDRRAAVGLAGHRRRGRRASGTARRSILALHVTRDYLLGLGGVAACAFVAILLATFAGLTLYVTGFAPATVAGVATSAARQHLAVALALGGVLAALLLIATPWSPYRKVAQPGLAATAVLAPILALLSQEGPRAFLYGFPVLPGLGGDPVLAVASVGGPLAIPLVVASSIEWVSRMRRSGLPTGASTRQSASSLAACLLVVAMLLWLALGTSGGLPGWLGGHFGAWPLALDAHPDTR